MCTMKKFMVAFAGALLTLSCISVAQSPDKIQQYQFAEDGDGYQLQLRAVPRPVAGPNQVLVKIHANSLNRRDFGLLTEKIGFRGRNHTGTIPLSDGAGEVIAIGDAVTRFKVGDRVAGSFFSDWTGGDFQASMYASARGASAGGMLSEIIVTDQQGLVAIPDYLSYAEAATLPCAAVTAWSALVTRGNLQANDYVLLEGTGGVSTFGLLFSAAMGARPIITSSSNEKLARARELGAIGTVNYRENANWEVKVRELTGGAGVDHVLEIGGLSTIDKAADALAFGGHMAIIGRLTGGAPGIPLIPILSKRGTVSGISVGSRDEFETMLEFMTKHDLHPVIDREFSFDQAQAAFDFMENGSYMGKIVITH